MDRLLVMEEVADLLRVPVSTLRRWRHTHTGPPSARIGRRVMYREREVQDWLEARFALPGDESAESAPEGHSAAVAS